MYGFQLQLSRMAWNFVRNTCCMPTNNIATDSTALGDGRERRKLEKEPREESRQVLMPVAKSKRVLSCDIVSLTAAREALEKANRLSIRHHHHQLLPSSTFLWIVHLDLHWCHNSCWTLRNFWIVPENLVYWCWFVQLMFRANGPLTLTLLSCVYRTDKDEHLAVKCLRWQRAVFLGDNLVGPVRCLLTKFMDKYRVHSR